MQWYYLDGQRQQIQTDEHSLRQLHAEGKISRDTLVWNETMTEWLALEKALPALTTGATPSKSLPATPALNPYTAPASPPALAISAGSGNVRAYAAILAQNAKWIRFTGVLMMIVGVVYCLTIVGAIIGWLPIWMGRLLNRAARLSTEVAASGSSQGLTEALESISRYFKIVGILALIAIVINVLTIIGLFVVGAVTPTQVPS